MQAVQKGAVGAIIEARLVEPDPDAPPTNPAKTRPLDVSTASTLEMEFRRPGLEGTTATKTAVLSGDGTDGRVRYVSEAAFLDELGLWTFQARVVWPGGSDLRSAVGAFDVLPNIADLEPPA